MTKKDWTGNNIACYANLGASNHSMGDREERDFYATAPLAVRGLMELEKFDKNIWEPACGLNHITNILIENGYNVRFSDIVDRSAEQNIEIYDFLSNKDIWEGDIITNPPYKYASEFVEKALETVTEGHKVAMFLKLSFLETKKRYELFQKYPIKKIYVASNRLGCAKNGEFDGKDNIASAVCYCWFIWEKGYRGETTIDWFNF